MSFREEGRYAQGPKRGGKKGHRKGDKTVPFVIGLIKTEGLYKEREVKRH